MQFETKRMMLCYYGMIDAAAHDAAAGDDDDVHFVVVRNYSCAVMMS